MSDVLFITPNDKKGIINESVGTLLLSTILRNNGIDSEILQFYRVGQSETFDGFIDGITAEICNAAPKIVSFYTRCDCYHIMLKIAERVKEKINCYIVFGGPQADITAKTTIEEIPYVDFVCCGEGENTVYPLFSSILKGEPDLSVAGLVYRKEGTVFVNPRPPMIEDLDALPLVDYSVLPYEFPVEENEDFPIDVGRGCPFGCTYCSTKSFWGQRYRLKSPQQIAHEISFYHNKYGATYFAFEHDMFTMNRKQVVETCRLIKQFDYKIKWRCSARIDCIDNELIDIMVDSGLKRIYIGIETGSPRMQKLVNKNLKLDGVIEKLNYIKSKNIEVMTSFIYGFPEETEEDVSLTLDLIARVIAIPKIKVQTHLCTFLPGTEMSKRYFSELTAAEKFSDITGDYGVAECADLIKAHPNLFWHFNEYKTELRTKLQFFSFFIRVFYFLKSAYYYFYSKYEKGNCIQMYYDFVQDNADTLKAWTSDTDMQVFGEILKNDRFAQRFTDDKHYPIIKEIYTIAVAKFTVNNDEAKTQTIICNHSPQALEQVADFDSLKQEMCVVTYSKKENGDLQTVIRK